MVRTALTIVLAACMLCLVACAAAVVGGVAAGGYYAGKSSRPADEVASDASITSAINTRYVKDELVSAFAINVSTYRGTVTLQGRVHSQQAAQRAVELARSVAGVNRVVSRLTVVTQ